MTELIISTYKKKLSPTQLAKCWINSKLEVEKLSVDEEELREFTSQELSNEELTEVRQRVADELAKYKEKFDDYVKKYCLVS